MCYNNVKNIKEVLEIEFFKFFILGIKYLISKIISFFKYFFIGLYNILTIIPRYFILGIQFIFFKNKKNKESKENRHLSFAIFALSISVYLVCVFLISRWYVQSLKIKYLSDDIVNSTVVIENDTNDDVVVDNNSNDNTGYNDLEYNYYPNDYWDYLNVPFMEVNFDELIDKNTDTVGWIKVDGTKVNYPVVQADDNDYYLEHAFNGNKNLGGWIYADYRVDFNNFGKNTIIYGHNMNNKTMFGSVPSMLNKSYFNDRSNNFIKISTPSSNSVWKVFSVYTIEPEVYYLRINFKTEDFQTFLDTLIKRSLYDFGVAMTTDDKVLTLSTCNDAGNKRVVVHAKMINIEYN